MFPQQSNLKGQGARAGCGIDIDVGPNETMELRLSILLCHGMKMQAISRLHGANKAVIFVANLA